MQKVIIVKSMNLTPENEVQERIDPLIRKGYRIILASTSLALQGQMDINNPGARFFGIPEHICYVTTVVLEKSSKDTL